MVARTDTTIVPTGAVTYDTVTDALGHITKTYKDALGRSFLTVYHDNSSTKTLYGVGTVAVPDHEPDSADTLIKMVVSTSPTTVYQAITGHQETKVDQMGLATDYFYDVSGRLTDVWLPAVENALNGGAKARPHWHYTYDADGNQLTQVDPKGHTTHFAYDALGRRISRTLENTKSESWTFDALGRTRTHTDFKGQTTVYVYDDTTTANGRLSKEYRFAVGATVFSSGALLDGNAAEYTSYAYDDLGRQAVVSEYAGSTPSRATTTTYDPATGQVASIASPEGTIHYEYDPATGRHTRTYTSYNDTHYSYDLQGRLWHVTVDKLNNQTLITPQMTTYTYDPVGSLKTVTQPNGVRTTYKYDALNRLYEEDVDRIAGGTTTHIQEFDYHLRADGLRDSETDKVYNTAGTSFTTTKVTWAYDDNGRLKSEFRDQGNDSTPGVPDDAGDYVDTFAFDLAGNRMTKAHDELSTASDETITYTYSSIDQLLTEDSETFSAHDVANTYDDNGSLETSTKGGVLTWYVWDLRNRMVGIDADHNGNTTSTGDTTYNYDSNGVRVSEATVGGSTMYFVNDPNNPTGYTKAIEEKDTTSSAPARSYVFGLKVEGQSDATNDTLYLMTDGHGSTRALIDVAGTVQEYEDYDAFGALLGGLAGNSSKTKLLFGGDGLYDPISGWTYQLARWRNDFGFTSYDSFEGDSATPAGLHKYVYTSGNPSNFSDPSGHFEFSLSGFLTGTSISAVVGGLLGGSLAGARAYAGGATWSVVMRDAFLGAAIGFAAGGLLGAGSYLGAWGISQGVALGGSTVAFSDAFAKTFIGFHLAALGYNAGEDEYRKAVESDNEFEKRIALIGMVASGFGMAASRLGLAFAGASELGRQELIGQLAYGTKINSGRVIDIAKMQNGRVAWLEIGNEKAGFKHILAGHEQDFANKGVPNYMIPRLIMKALSSGRIVGQGGSGSNAHSIYEVEFNGATQRLAVGVGSNGFVVTAYPK